MQVQSTERCTQALGVFGANSRGQGLCFTLIIHINKNYHRAFLILGILGLCSIAEAVPPLQQPLVQRSDITDLGTITIPPTDGTNNPPNDSLDYSPRGPLGLGADGKSIYFACHAWFNKVARLTIPAIGGTATVAEPCMSIPRLAEINPGDPNAKILAGVLDWQGKVLLTAYSYYDGNGTAVASHFVSASKLSGLTGPPFALTVKPGFVAGWMGPIPQEWRASLGGPAFSGLAAIAIIGRSSHGPSLSIFDPATVGQQNPAPATMLIGYPQDQYNPAIGHYSNPGPVYNGATNIGGPAFVPGTRSVLFIESHGTDPKNFCYGTGTTDPALAGQPVPGEPGNFYCYDPTNGSKGPHCYPYKHMVVAYDAADLVAVKEKSKQPWEVNPYALWTLDLGYGPAAYVSSAVYDPATSRWYVGMGGRTIRVLAIAAGNSPPPSPCDLDSSGSTLVNDVQLCANQAMGNSSCIPAGQPGSGDIDRNGLCQVPDVQRVINAALGGACVSP